MPFINGPRGSPRSRTLACQSNPKSSRSSTHGTKQRCSCGWVAAVLIAGAGPCIEHAGPNPALISGAWSMVFTTVRSRQPAGTPLSLTVSLPYKDAGCNIVTPLPVPLNLVVGTTTPGWVQIGTVDVGGSPYYIYACSLTLPSQFYEQEDYAVRLPFAEWASNYQSSSGPVSNYLDPGGPTPYLIHWADGIQKLEADHFSTGYDLNGKSVRRGVFKGGFVSQSAWCDVVQRLESPDLGTCHINVEPLYFFQSTYSGPLLETVCFNNAVFSTPAVISVDDAFDMRVTFINPFTGNIVDGTHSLSNTSDQDVDTVPTLGLHNQDVAGCQVVEYQSIVRNGFADYTIKGIQFLTRAGPRQLVVDANFQEGTFAAVSHHPILSAQVLVLPGAPAAVDCGEGPRIPIAVAKSTLTLHGRILDQVGLFCDYNIVPTATNLVTASLSETAPNQFTSPQLLGTTSRAAMSGIATFDLSILGLGRNYSIDFASAGLSPANNTQGNSAKVSIACDLAFESPGPIQHGIPVTIKVDIVAADGSPLIPTSVDDLILSGTGFDSFGSQTPSGGQASWTGTFPAAGTYLLKVATSGTNYDGPGSGLPQVELVVIVG